MSNVYYDPEKFGLTTVGEVDWSSGSYEFDLTVVWKNEKTGQLYWDEDAGCSCPTPFEGQGVHDLNKATFHEIAAHLNARAEGSDYYDRRAEVATLLGRLA